MYGVRAYELRNDTFASQGNKNTMDMDEDMPDSQRTFWPSDWEIEVDYSDLDVHQRNDGTEVEQEFQDDIKNITIEIERMTPNLSAIDRLYAVENRLKE